MLKDDVLHTLEQNRGRVVTGGDLARLYGVSRTAVWKAVHALREEGNEIQSLPNSGYRLSDHSDGLLERSIRDGLTASFFGKELVLLKTVGSTNRYVKELDIAQSPEGLAVVADEQTGGRGRMNRPFFSPAREGVYLSVLLKPAVSPGDTRFLTICAAVAVSEAIEHVCGFGVEIKWVNDICFQGKKLCGILTETAVSAELQAVEYAVVGIGINTGRVAEEVSGIATSIQEISGLRGVRNRLVAEVLNRLEAVYLDYTARGGKADILNAYTGRLSVLGRRVKAEERGAVFEATVDGVDESGALIVRDADGAVRRIAAGEITVV